MSSLSFFPDSFEQAFQAFFQLVSNLFLQLVLDGRGRGLYRALILRCRFLRGTLLLFLGRRRFLRGDGIDDPVDGTVPLLLLGGIGRRRVAPRNGSILIRARGGADLDQGYGRRIGLARNLDRNVPEVRGGAALVSANGSDRKSVV